MTGPGRSLWDRVFTDAGSSSAPVHCWTGAGFTTSTWSDVVRDAERMTAGLRRRGVAPGTRVAAVLTNTPDAVRGLLAVWLAGGVLASLPVPSRGFAEGEYGATMAAVCARLDPVVVLAEERILDRLPESLRAAPGAASWESLRESGRVDPTPPGDDDVAFIQYSSGSTGNPKGCVLTAAAIAAQLELIAGMIDSRPGHDLAMSWLPLSHDMGVFGCLLTPLAFGFGLALSTPERFALGPRTWFGDIASFGATVTAGPNTALALSARASASGRARLPGPITLRACIVGAERVEWSTLRAVVDTFAPWGMDDTVLMPAYGLAEATLAVTHTPVAHAPRHLRLDAAALAEGRVVPAEPADPAPRLLVSAGGPAVGVELPEAEADAVGRLRVRSPSLAAGYWADPERTAAHFQDSTLITNDVGFVYDGQLYPVGRDDDQLSVAGRKIYAQEIERTLDTLPELRSGCSALIADHDGGLTLFAEPARRGADFEELAAEAAGIAMDKAAVVIDTCVFLSRNSLPKTPSGKIQRHRCARLGTESSSRRLAVVALTRSANGSPH